MRICDRCSATPIVETIKGLRNSYEVDLCGTCLEEFQQFSAPVPKEVAPERKKPGPKPKGDR